ncbi:MAG: bifunctional [glutamate--ammonia ligase]-adenylyl-L-tyrosine phosphorylase/[glutamate--ammonia-ligase] adenylyltransferase [Gammaproteobacteria bacterium]|nr:bifunctional [glutamate--ammonia ligase]-adenylyl-L-tyrosine phosphorylase/[glutamate--ammonia-ligase] adenylyltransferase [Gammaproteobacteria bacterium]
MLGMSDARTLPAALQAHAGHYRETFDQATNEAGISLSRHAQWLPEIHLIWACSDFVAQSCVRQPQMLADLLDSGDLLKPYAPDDYQLKLQAVLAGVRDDAQLKTALRTLRRREMVRIACRDLAGWASLDETLRELSWLAEGCLDGALAWLHRDLSTDWGVPCAHDGAPQSLVVLGMGKLGGGELNFSSDIDLIFAYAEDGQTTGGRRELSNQEFFTRLGQRLIGAIGDRTAEGFVFRVDMRLRPNGDSGPLVMNFDGMEQYYQAHGREWERYAMIKARTVAGDKAAGERLLATLRPFVYRRYLDFGAFESLREMKEMIRREIERRGLQNNVKLGTGGIREVEFIGQSFQLIRGGREPELQQRQILPVLKLLGARGDLPDYAVRDLIDAYTFLRRTENRLQEFADQQTHLLPDDEFGRLCLAASMGYGDWQTFSQALERHRRRVHEHFERVFAAPQTGGATQAGSPDLGAAWSGALEARQAEAVLAAAGFDDPGEALRLCVRLREGHAWRALSSQGRERMDRLMPLLLGAAGRSAQSVVTLQRLTRLIEAIARRTAYLALLVEHPLALSQLVKLCAASPWIAAMLARHPLLLDELLDPRSLYAPLSRVELTQDLDQRLKAIPPQDLEQQMEALRQFKQAATLHVAAADVAGAMPLMIVSDHLTDIAEIVLAQVLRLAWRHLAERHGQPQCRIGGKLHAPGFAILGYGKLGGIELGYGSDLDLVFLHDSAGEEQYTTGPKVIDNAVFFARLGQRIIHILNTQTPAGVLYEVDMRLRPSGASGPLVSSLEAYTDYQHRQAWTWEHQALVRARVVAGDGIIAAAFGTLRREVLARRRDLVELRREVREMRERMMRELGSRQPGVFDLKQHRGGIADIEFMVQYGVLAWACDHPELLEFSDNIRQLEGLAKAGLLPADDVRLLGDAYRAYRAALHRLTLQDQPALVAATEFVEYRAGVERIWRALMNEETEQ